jgi:hypothetical protein
VSVSEKSEKKFAKCLEIRKKCRIFVIGKRGRGLHPSSDPKQTKAGAPAQRVEGVKGYEGNNGKHSSD